MTTLAPSMSRPSAWTEPHPKLEGISPMDKLYNRLDGMYPNRWRANFANADAIDAWKEAWAEAFVDDGITPHEVAAGLKACRRMFDWPPSLTEFLRACRPTISSEAAYHEAVAGMVARSRGERGEWSHPAIYWAAVRVTSHDLLSVGWQAIRGRWEAALRDVMAKGKWEPVPEPTKALPAPGQSHLSRDQQRQAMEQVRSVAASTNPERAASGRDPLAWARAVIAHPKGRTPTVIDMARRALGGEATA